MIYQHGIVIVDSQIWHNLNTSNNHYHQIINKNFLFYFIYLLKIYYKVMNILRLHYILYYKYYFYILFYFSH